MGIRSESMTPPTKGFETDPLSLRRGKNGEVDNPQVEDKKFFWMKRHPFSEGLSDQAIEEIGEQIELVDVEAGEVHPCRGGCSG